MNAKKKFTTGLIKFELENEFDEVFCSFKMNPTDVNLMKRAEEVAEYFNKWQMETANLVSGDELSKYNSIIEEKINYLLGYDATKEVFGEVTATTIFPNGSVFVIELMEFIFEKLEPEIEKRNKNIQAKMQKYTEKYQKK